MKQPPRVALIIETSSPYGCRILGGVTKYLRSHHRWSVFLEQRELGTRPPDWLFSGQWDGILSRPTDPELAAMFRKMRVPVVDLNDQFDNLGLPWVGSNHHGIGQLGAQHLLERGYRHFAFAGFKGELWAAQRRDGFRAAIDAKERGPVHLHESPWRGTDSPDWNEDLGKIETWLKQLPQPLAVMTCNDVRGMHVLEACARLGLAVPEQVAVVGVDNDPILCELCSPPLSSVEPNPEGIGYAAAELLDNLMAGSVSSQASRLTIDPVKVTARRSTDTLAIDDYIVVNALRFIHQQAVFGCDVNDVLKHARVSRSVLERRFRLHLKRSPMAEIRRVQLNRVKQLLAETDLTLERIAQLSGFEHPEYMSVMFKRTCGQTPGNYRRQRAATG